MDSASALRSTALVPNEGFEWKDTIKVALVTVGVISLVAGVVFVISYKGHGISAMNGTLLGRVCIAGAMVTGGGLIATAAFLHWGQSKTKKPSEINLLSYPAVQYLLQSSPTSTAPAPEVPPRLPTAAPVTNLTPYPIIQYPTARSSRLEAFIPDNQRRIHDARSIVLSKDVVVALHDETRLSLQDCLYRGDLPTERNVISQRLRNPALKELIDYTNTCVNPIEKHDAIACLFVYLGIKPVLVIEQGWERFPRLYQIIEKLSSPTFVLGRANRMAFVVNEAPLEAFNPRRYLEPLAQSNISLMEAAIHAFIHQGTPVNDQMLSYLLGFGPSWEAYRNQSSKRETDFTEQSRFTDAHYAEIGKVLCWALPSVKDEDPTKVGFAYHMQFSTLLTLRCCNFRGLDQHKPLPISDFLATTGTEGTFDGITARTDYFRRSITLKKLVMDHLHLLKEVDEVKRIMINNIEGLVT